MSLTSFPATLFDGTNPTAHPVRVDVLDRDLLVWSADATSAPALLRRGSFGEVRLSEPLAYAPRLVRWRDGTTLEVAATHEFTAALGQAGLPPTWVARLQRGWPFAIVALVLLIGLLVFAYMRGIPAAARWVAFALPPGVEQRIGAEVLGLLDEHQLAPSQLAAPRREEIAAQFAGAATRAAPDVAYRLEFRRTAKGNGINALALPGGTIVLLDGLAERADNTQLLGVLGHELGHVTRKHGMRNVVQAVSVGAIIGVIWGDFAGFGTNLPLVLGIMQNTRDFEREADDFAVALLRANDLSAQPLIDFFKIVVELEHKRGGSIVPDFLSSHPPTPERIERLKQFAN